MNKGGSVAKILGPGWSPFTKNMPIKTAAMVEPGIPSVSSGIIEGPETALLADSGAAIPSTTPVPHFSLFLAFLFLRHKQQNKLPMSRGLASFQLKTHRLRNGTSAAHIV